MTSAAPSPSKTILDRLKTDEWIDSGTSGDRLSSVPSEEQDLFRSLASTQPLVEEKGKRPSPVSDPIERPKRPRLSAAAKGLGLEETDDADMDETLPTQSEPALSYGSRPSFGRSFSDAHFTSRLEILPMQALHLTQAKHPDLHVQVISVEKGEKLSPLNDRLASASTIGAPTEAEADRIDPEDIIDSVLRRDFASAPRSLEAAREDLAVGKPGWGRIKEMGRLWNAEMGRMPQTEYEEEEAHMIFPDEAESFAAWVRKNYPRLFEFVEGEREENGKGGVVVSGAQGIGKSA